MEDLSRLFAGLGATQAFTSGSQYGSTARYLHTLSRYISQDPLGVKPYIAAEA